MNLPYMGVFSNSKNGFSYYLIGLYNRLHEGIVKGVIFKGGTIWRFLKGGSIISTWGNLRFMFPINIYRVISNGGG